MDVATNHLNLMILIIVHNTWALDVLKTCKIFPGLKIIGGLLWNIPIIVNIRKAFETKIHIVGQEKDDKEPLTLHEMKVQLHNLKKKNAGKLTI